MGPPMPLQFRDKELERSERSGPSDALGQYEASRNVRGLPMP
jgi:hypothetical protein